MNVASNHPPLVNSSGRNSDRTRAQQIAVVVGCGVVVSAALFLLRQYNPEQHAFFPKCGFHALTGLDCPGCGGQRALHQLLHGNLTEAFRYNALLVSLAPLGLWMLIRRGVRFASGHSLPTPFSHPGWPWVLAGLVIVFGVVRNLPFAGFPR